MIVDEKVLSVTVIKTTARQGNADDLPFNTFKLEVVWVFNISVG